MEGFKIKPKRREPRTQYASGLCRTKGEKILIQVDLVGDQWHMVSASNVNAGGRATLPPARNEIILDGAQVYQSGKFQCSSCKNKNIVSCGNCGKIVCWDGVSKRVACPHCKHEGDITGRMKAVAVEPFVRKGDKHGAVKRSKQEHFSAF